MENRQRSHHELQIPVNRFADIITGTSNNPASGLSEGRARNAVHINGMYYHVGVIWDDRGRTVFYAYFNKKTAEAISEDRTISPPQPIPCPNAAAKTPIASWQAGVRCRRLNVTSLQPC